MCKWYYVNGYFKNCVSTLYESMYSVDIDVAQYCATDCVVYEVAQ